MFYFTSINSNYLSKAVLLAKTLKQQDPAAKFILALVDDIPGGVKIPDNIFDGILYTDQLKCWDNPQRIFFQYNVVEACTAVKPATALAIMDQYHCEKICYLDPDIAVFSRFTEVEDLLDVYSMVFTPHTTVPEEKDYYIIGNEILFLKRGTNNLGFFAVKSDEEGRRFLTWWHKRLTAYCLDDRCKSEKLLSVCGLAGVFTDQKWIDLVPSFFDNYYILKHPGYNVSTWNLSHRIASKESDGSYLINGLPLRFFHFSGIDSGDHMAVMEELIADYPHVKTMLPLSEWYISEDTAIKANFSQKAEWKYSCYSNGEKIPDEQRKLFYIRKDVWNLFEDPFTVTPEKLCFYNWVRGEHPNQAAIEEKIEEMRTYRPPWPVRIIKKILLYFTSQESPVYQKLKRIWHTLRS